MIYYIHAKRQAGCRWLLDGHFITPLRKALYRLIWCFFICELFVNTIRIQDIIWIYVEFWSIMEGNGVVERKK